MYKTKHVLIDGQVLDNRTHEYLFKVFYNQEIDIFNFYNGKLRLKYVGYIEVNIDNNIHQLYCFPKEYEYVDCEIMRDSQYEMIKHDFKNVIKTIIKASKSLRSQGQTLDFETYTSNIYYLEQIIKHYYQYGNIVEVEKNHKRTNTGKIDWNKTIARIIPKYANQSFIYDEFIIEKKNINITFLTKLISKVLCEETVKYDFILPVINTGIDYEDILEISNDQSIELLLELRNKTFKDYLHNVIDNLISYLRNDTNNAIVGSIIGTNNFELVWEELVSFGLGEKYKHSVIYTISSENSDKNKEIRIDHLNIEEKVIVDSKYYVNQEDENYQVMFDYKQLYYNYYLVYETFMKDMDNQLSSEKLKREYQSWTNVLIRPGKSEHNLDNQDKLKVILNDGLELLTLYCDIKNIMHYYANNKSNFTIDLDINFYKNQEIKKEKL